MKNQHMSINTKNNVSIFKMDNTTTLNTITFLSSQNLMSTFQNEEGNTAENTLKNFCQKNRKIIIIK